MTQAIRRVQYATDNSSLFTSKCNSVNSLHYKFNVDHIHNNDICSGIKYKSHTNSVIPDVDICTIHVPHFGSYNDFCRRSLHAMNNGYMGGTIPHRNCVACNKEFEYNRGISQVDAKFRGAFDRMILPGAMWWNLEVTLRSLVNYKQHMTFLCIRSGKISGFIPYMNNAYENAWHKSNHMLTSSIVECIESINCSSDTDSSDTEVANVDISKLWFEGNRLCGHYDIDAINPYNNNTTFANVAAIRDMFNSVCEKYNVPDVIAMINTSNVPYVWCNDSHTNDYMHRNILDTILADNPSTDGIPMFSMYTANGYMDYAIPTPLEWQVAIGKVIYTEGYTHTGSYEGDYKLVMLHMNDIKYIPWDDKCNTLFFRGLNEGRCNSECINMRRVIISTINNNIDEFIQHCNVDVGLIPARDSIYTDGMAVYHDRSDSRYSELIADPVPYTRWGTYKYILDIEGEAVSETYPIMMRTGSLILRMPRKSYGNVAWYDHRLKGFDIMEYLNSKSYPMYEGTYIYDYVEYQQFDHVLLPHDIRELPKIIDWCNKNSTICSLIGNNSRILHNSLFTRDAIEEYILNLLYALDRDDCQPYAHEYDNIEYKTHVRQPKYKRIKHM